jgi:hypothetical protein
MARTLAIIIAVFLLAMQQGDTLPSARASVCQNSDCTRSGAHGYEPALIRVTFYVPPSTENRRAQGALYCSSGYESESELEPDRGQQIRMARDVPAGECTATVAVLLRDGSIREGKSQPVVIR